MSQTQQGTQQDEPLAPLLTASAHDVRHLVAILRGVNFGPRATLIITDNGLTVTVEEARTLMGRAYIWADMFDEYVYTPPPSQMNADADGAEHTLLEISLGTLVECLNIFGTAFSAPANTGARRTKRLADDGDSEPEREPGAQGPLDRFLGAAPEKGTGMRLSYAGPGYPLSLLVAEDSKGPTATCELATFDAEPGIDLPFDAEAAVLKIILKSSWLRDALTELDASCEKITIVGNPPPVNAGRASARSAGSNTKRPLFRIKAEGTFGSSEMDYPNDREVLETFECSAPVEFSYRTSHIGRTARALAASTKTSLRIEEGGMLSLQFLMPSPRARGAGMSEGFVDFRCLALDEDV